MERRGFVRPIQGGGEGAGFNVPRQILQLEPEISIDISREILTVASRNRSTRKERSTSEEFENEEVGQTVNDAKMEVWKTELQQRLFLLHHRKKESSRVIDMKMTTLQSRSGIGGVTEHVRNEERTAQKFLSHDAFTVPTNRDFVEFTDSLRKKQKTECDRGESTVVKFIPGLPTSIERVVELWRKGDEKTDCQPLRKFADSETRKRFVPNHTHRTLTLSGQKNSFLRFKSLVERVQELGLVRIRLTAIGNDEDWSQAIPEFHSIYDRDGKPQALSRVLRDNK